MNYTRFSIVFHLAWVLLLLFHSIGFAAPPTTTRISVDSNGNEGDNDSNDSSISADGRYVAFQSSATDLVSGDTNAAPDIFVHDRQTGTTTRVSVDSNGIQAALWKASTTPSITADGRYVAFSSQASNLVLGDTSNNLDIFVHDRQTGETTRVSVNSNGVEGTVTKASYDPSISADGRYVTFRSEASNLDLVTLDTNDAYDVFVHDRQTGETTRVSVASNGDQGLGTSSYPSISGDGRYVAFRSSASNLIANDTNNKSDIFVHDRQTKVTTRVSVDSNGNQATDNSAYSSISSNGQYVVFDSAANNLVASDTNNTNDVFVHDRQTGVTSRVSINSSNIEGNGYSSEPSISADGQLVAFYSEAGNLVSGDTNDSPDIFVHNLQTSTTTRVSVDSSNIEGNIDSYTPSISADGHYVAFGSRASNLVSDDTNSYSDIFVHGSIQDTAFSWNLFLPAIISKKH